MLQDVNTEMHLTYEGLEQLWEIMAFENNGTTSVLVDFFMFCAGVTTSEGSSVTYSTSSTSADVVVTSLVDLSQEKNRFPWLNVTNLDECHVANRQFKNYIDDVILAPYGHIKRDQEFFKLANRYYDGHSFEQGTKCFALIEEARKAWIISGLFLTWLLVSPKAIRLPWRILLLMWTHSSFQNWLMILTAVSNRSADGGNLLLRAFEDVLKTS